MAEEKKPFSMRISPEGLWLLNQLSAKYGISMSDVVEIAIREKADMAKVVYQKESSPE